MARLTTVEEPLGQAGPVPGASSTVRLLGPLRVLGADGEIDLGGRKPRALLTLLLIHAGRPVSVDRLVDAIWGDDPPARVEVSLQSYVSRLRRALDGVAAIVTRQPGYLIDLAPGLLDLARAEALVGEGRVALAGGDVATAVDALTRAVALWQGRPLDEFADEDWARPEAIRLAELRLAAWEDLADARLAVGDHRHLIADLEPLVAEAPLREALIGRLVLALGRSGRQVDGLAVLRRHREHLVEELGLDPGPELERLEQALLAQAPEVVGTAEPVAAPAAGPRSPDDLLVVPAAAEAVPGRGAETAELARVLDRLATGGGGVALLSGEPGIGKSHLVAWCLDHVGPEVAVGRLRAGEDSAVPPLWPWRVALDELLGTDVPSPLHAVREEHDPYELRLEVGRALLARAAERPVLLVADDLQWLDPASLGLLQYLAVETGRAPFAILVACRSPGSEPPRPLAACLDELARQPGACWMRVEGLDEDGVAAVAAAVVGRPVLRPVVRALRERTGGNPFLVRELTRQLVLERREDDPEAVRDPRVVPPTVLEGVRRRVDLLPEDVAEALRMAAVAGGHPDIDLLARATGLEPDAVLAALERACAADLLVAEPQPGGLRFAHSLIAEALLESQSPVSRARRHRALLAALPPAVPGGSGSGVDRLLPARARHALGALPLGDPAEAMALLVSVAEQAMVGSAPEEAAEWWQRALELIDRQPGLDPESRWRALDGRARAQLGGGDLAAGLASVLDACAEAEGAGEPLLLARSATAVVQLSLWPWRNYLEVDRRMIRTLERAIATLGGTEPALRVRALAGLGVERYYLPDPTPADDASAAAVELARTLDEPALLALALDLRYVAVWRPDRMTELEAIADELVVTAEAAHLDDRTLFVGTFLRLVARLTQGRVEAARDDEALCLALADRLRTPSLLVMFDSYRAMRAGLDGDFDEAERWIAESMELHRRTQVWPAEDARLGLIAPLVIERGGAEQLVDALLAAADGPEGRAAHAFGMLVLAESGDAERLRVEMAARGPLPERSRDWAWLAMTCGFAGMAALAGDHEAARVHADDLAPHAGQLALFGSDGCFGAVDEYRGRCLALVGDPAAGPCFEAAADLHQRLQAPHLEARTYLHHGTWLAGQDPDAARALLDRAAGLARRAPALAARIEVARSTIG